ncbi:Detected protein of unknown function [Hibiscus syriacus]|uniref:Uncharacterized protein n=1 Tax=Hibiscus syriacus TaxID=106335 RepID=A0A6A3AK51_HIBSY|nr:uncharacterized protein At4g00950-like isoform X1 [Hibiscus syriacus]KAE8703645.1 Detected protein of unknown function [Hibiscus syriacus]
MGFEAEKEPSRLPLFSSLHAHMVSPERPGTLTPPLRASASVPFRWEEEPGKPKAYTTVATFSDDFARKCLELPPRLLLLQEANKKKTNNNEKLCSTTTVLDGPYLGRARFQSSSFRMVKSERYGSFSAGSFFPENMVLERGDGTMVVSERGNREEAGFLGSRRRSDVGGKSYVFPSYRDKGEEYSSSSVSVSIKRMKKRGSLNSLSHSKFHFWASIYEGLKQVVPWNIREKKDRHMGADF